MTTEEQTYWQQRIENIREPLHILQQAQTGQRDVVAESAYAQWQTQVDATQWNHVALLPAVHPEWLGSQTFLSTHQVRFPYIVGEMANGIATAQMVIAAVNAGMMGFFGAAGLLPNVIEENLHTIKTQLHDSPKAWGSNLIHSPNEPHLEAAAVDLYLRYQVERVSASAYMSLNPNIVYYACKGLSTDSLGNIIRRNHIIAKISRPEVAELFLAPAPPAMLQALVEAGKLTTQEAQLAAHIPLAEDITVEADSGGHTDNRPLGALFPTILLLAERMRRKHGYATTVRVGAAGGLGTPTSIASAFSLGAAYVLTGSINQAAVESGLSLEGKEMLAKADIADVMMAPAADMFELGVKLQVLKRGTLFGSRALKLYELYAKYDSLEAIPATERDKLEQQILQNNLAAIWETTARFFQQRDPQQLVRAEQDPKHRMALVFRSYLGLSSRWAITGETKRKADYQIWCGPAMGAFNAWVSGSCLEPLNARTVAQIGHNLLEGAATLLRAQHLRSLGFSLPTSVFIYQPRVLA